MKRKRRKKNKVVGYLKNVSFFLILMTIAIIVREVRESVETDNSEAIFNLGTDYYEQQAYVLENYKISQYFEIPVFDGWAVEEIDQKKIDCDEVILLTKNSINAIIFLEDYHIENGEILQIQDSLYEELKSKYPDCSFQKSDKLSGDIAIVDVDYNNSEDYMHILVAKINDKLVTLSYSYKISDIYEAELYFSNLAGNVNRVIKGV